MLKLLGGLLLFAAGLVAGWVASGEFSSDWVEAIGTWVGAVGTIAAILWAVHTFQQETRHRKEDIDRESEDQRKREFTLAEAVSVRCSGASADSIPGQVGVRTLTSVWIRLINGTGEAVTIEHFELPGIEFRGNIMRFLPPTLTPGQTFRELIDVEPSIVTDAETSDRAPLTNAIPVLRYSIDGVSWERTGAGPPLRLR